MRATVTIDDELFWQALSFVEPGTDKAELLRQAMQTFVRVESAKRLACLGGTAPDMEDVPRDRAGSTVK